MLTNGFKALLYREVYRFMRLFMQTIVPPIVTTFLYIMIFGKSLGGRIGPIDDISYELFILPGLAQMGLINGAFSNSSFSVFQAKMERSIENLLTAPLSYWQITMGYVFGGVVRGLCIGVFTLLVAALFVDFPFSHLGVLIVSWVLSAVLFSSLGLIGGVLCKTWDKMSNVQTFILTPLIYLGGVFYSIQMLPPFWQQLSHFNPVFYSIDLTRYGLLGYATLQPLTILCVLFGLSCLALSLAMLAFKKSCDFIVH